MFGVHQQGFDGLMGEPFMKDDKKCCGTCAFLMAHPYQLIDLCKAPLPEWVGRVQYMAGRAWGALCYPNDGDECPCYKQGTD